MKKLQLYITMSKGEFRNVIDINPEPGIKAQVTDLRSAVCQVDYQPSTKTIFYLMKYTDTGVFIIVLRTIPEILGNYLAAWIFVPYSCVISDRDVCAIVDYVAQKVAGSSLTAQVISDIRHLFDHEYEEDAKAPIFAPTEGSGYAYRYYGGNTGTTLNDLIGRFRYQTCYLPFAGVLMVDATQSSNVSGTNLTSAPKETMATLLPPRKGAQDGYKPTIYDCPFDVAFFAPMDRTFDIIWKKPGSPDVKQPVTLSKAEDYAPDFSEYTRPVTVHTERPVRQKPEPVQKPEVKVKPEPVEVQVPQQPEYDEPEDDEKEENVSFLDRYSDMIYKGIYFAVGFLCGVVVALLCTCDREDRIETPSTSTLAETVEAATDTPSDDAAASTLAQQISDAASKVEETPDPQPVAQPAQQPAEQSQAQPQAQTQPQAQPAAQPTSLDAAIKYLDSSKTWKKEDMEKYSDLKGLYDDMNNVNRKKLINVWGPKLSASKNFQTVVSHSKLSLKKKAKRTPYNTANDHVITLQAYLNNIDP